MSEKDYLFFGSVIAMTAEKYSLWVDEIKSKLEEDVEIHCISGKECAVVDHLYDVMAVRFNFPEWFGRNPHALVDCMRGVARFSKGVFVLKIENAFDFFRDESAENYSEIIYFFSVISDAWAAGCKQGLSCDHEPKIFCVALVYDVL
jgi:RNAse (barnase) inhibitor barstar